MSANGGVEEDKGFGATAVTTVVFGLSSLGAGSCAGSKVVGGDTALTRASSEDRAFSDTGAGDNTLTERDAPESSAARNAVVWAWLVAADFSPADEGGVTSRGASGIASKMACRLRVT